MPNHFYGIVFIVYSNNSSLKDSHQNNESFYKVILGDIIGAFKSITTNEYIKKVNSKELPSYQNRIWKRNYHDRIIRNENEIKNIREYIRNNPINWKFDYLFEFI
ncbi:MAG: hypothetical protein HGGPFJEG_02274 [Ignavibacteria bacterium]|nr:hypothetical protein [Ignavibacteria bacterium]